MASPEKKPLPPYLPWKTIYNYWDSLRVFMPEIIDRSSMRSYSGAIQSWLLNGLRYLNMIDEHGRPKPRLHQIAEASAEERKPMLRQLIQAEYGFLNGIDLSRATPTQLDRAFETTGAQGDTVRKCVAFFIAMAKEAELPLSPLIMKTQRRSGTAPPATPPSPETGQTWQQMMLIKFPNFDPTWPDDVKAKWFEGFQRLMKMGEEGDFK